MNEFQDEESMPLSGRGLLPGQVSGTEVTSTEEPVAVAVKAVAGPIALAAGLIGVGITFVVCAIIAGIVYLAAH